jgi:hypothetical protein
MPTDDDEARDRLDGQLVLAVEVLEVTKRSLERALEAGQEGSKIDPATAMLLQLVADCVIHQLCGRVGAVDAWSKHLYDQVKAIGGVVELDEDGDLLVEKGALNLRRMFLSWVIEHGGEYPLPVDSMREFLEGGEETVTGPLH